jgi:hypothetical protein
MYWGELWAYGIVQAVLNSPQWPRTLLIYIYDEHGAYYDHVPPPAAIPPDSIPPRLQPGDPAGGYDLYGPRVPAVVVSPYAKPQGVTDVVHDHTSVLATIEAKVEPAGAHQPRRQCEHGHGLPRPRRRSGRTGSHRETIRYRTLGAGDACGLEAATTMAAQGVMRSAACAC